MAIKEDFMAFSRQTTTPQNTNEATHTMTLVVHRDIESLGAGSKLAFQTDGDSCPRDLRAMVGSIRAQIDKGRFKMGDVLRDKDGEPIPFYVTPVPKADDSAAQVDWD